MEKNSLCFILNKRNDLIKLDLDENLWEHDRVISPARVNGALEISGQTLDAAFVNYNAKVQVHAIRLHASKMHRCFFFKRCVLWKVVLICSYLNNYFDIDGETWEIQQKLTMFNEFRLIVNLLGKSDWMSTDFCIFRDVLDIFTHYKLTHYICTHLYFSIKDEMFNYA